MDVQNQGGKVSIILDDEALKTSLKYVATTVVLFVEPDRVTDAKPLQSAGQIGLPGPNQEMEMIWHQGIPMDLNLKPFHHAPEGFKKSRIVSWVVEDFPALISSGKNVVKGVGEIHAHLSGHGRKIPSSGGFCQEKIDF